MFICADDLLIRSNRGSTDIRRLRIGTPRPGRVSVQTAQTIGDIVLCAMSLMPDGSTRSEQTLVFYQMGVSEPYIHVGHIYRIAQYKPLNRLVQRLISSGNGGSVGRSRPSECPNHLGIVRQPTTLTVEPMYPTILHYDEEYDE